jgi:hypothetical protein
MSAWRKIRGPLVLLAVAALVTAAAGPALAQCSMCRSVLEQSAEGRKLSEQLNLAILVMFFAPYLVFGSFVVMMFRGRIGGFLSRLLRVVFFR